MPIRELTEQDAAEYWALRLRALREDPEAFGSSYEESKDRPLQQTNERLREGATSGDSFTLGAYDEGRLVGMVVIVRAPNEKSRHTANLYSMYVAPEARGRGYGRALVGAAIERARAMPGLEQIYLAVVTTNTSARSLYLSVGFEIYGIIPRALKLGETYLDEEEMVLWLHPARAGSAS
ncbi:MAG TPA: GNAT family N-acetyltransferase [Ktedonobacterales bacterium]|nr:GNAT family N-acetyltransferase [Ktedonobacterales bacterium]